MTVPTAAARWSSVVSARLAWATVAPAAAFKAAEEVEVELARMYGAADGAFSRPIEAARWHAVVVERLRRTATAKPVDAFKVATAFVAELAELFPAELDARPAPAPEPEPAPPAPAPPAPAPTPPAPAPTPSVPPPPAGAAIASIELTAARTGTLPIAFAQAFRKGDLRAGAHLAGLQVTALSTWPDGSARVALVAGAAAMRAGEPHSVQLATGSPLAGTALTPADLRARLSAHPVTIEAGAFGSASWSGADFDAPFETVAAGPAMAQWKYRKPIGSDAHLVGWLEVRLWTGGAVEVLPWVENGYLRVPAPGERVGSYSFSLGGIVRFSEPIALLNHQRTPLVSGAALTHWLGEDPGIVCRHDAAYLMSTKVVPNYVGRVPDAAPAVRSLPATFTPLQQGKFPNAMGETGYDGSKGLFAEWSALYLTNGSPITWAALQRQAYSAGRYGIHFRDEITNRPVRFSQHPRLVIHKSSNVAAASASSNNTMTPVATGGLPPVFTASHQPDLGAMAFLVTGWTYHLETVQFQACTNYLKNSDTNRQQAQGIIRTDAGSNTVRGAAWALRTLAHAAALTPDSDPLAAEFRASMDSNVAWYYAIFVAQPNNPQGMVAEYGDYEPKNKDRPYMASVFQQDFYTGVIGYCLSLDIGGVDQAKLVAFFRWKAQSIVGRLGGTGPTEYPARDAAPYTIAYSPSKTPDWAGGTGPWYPHFGAVFDATVGGDRAVGDLRGGNFPEASSYWGNLHPAIAEAVDHGVPGAAEGWQRMTSASNYPKLLADFNAECVWGVWPRSVPPVVATPAPQPAPPAPAPPPPAPMPPAPAPPAPTPAPPPAPAPSSGPLVLGARYEWVVVPNSVLKGSPAWLPGIPHGWGNQLARVNGENGLALNEQTGELILGPTGGHGDWALNAMAKINPPDGNAWRLLHPGSKLEDIGPYAGPNGPIAQYNRDGLPNSRHTYQGTHWLVEQQKYICIGGFTWPHAGGAPEPSSFDLPTNKWDPPGTWPAHLVLGNDSTSGGVGAYVKHPITEDIFYAPGGGYHLLRLDVRARAWIRITAKTGTYFPYTEVLAIDSKRNCLTVLTTRGGPQVKNLLFARFDLTTGAMTPLQMEPSAAWDEFKTMDTNHAGLHYNHWHDFYLYHFGGTGQGGKVWLLQPNDAGPWSLSKLPMTGAAVPDGLGVAHGNVLSRFRVWRDMVIVQPAADQPMFAARMV